MKNKTIGLLFLLAAAGLALWFFSRPRGRSLSRTLGLAETVGVANTTGLQQMADSFAGKDIPSDLTGKPMFTLEEWNAMSPEQRAMWSTVQS